MLTGLQDVYDQVRHRGGLLARRANDPSVAPTADDEPALEPYVRQGLAEIATKTRRLNDAIRIPTEADTADYDLPRHVDRIREAVIDQDGTHEVKIDNGHDVMLRAEHPQTQKGTPRQIGVQGGRVWLWPVPSSAGTLRLYVTQNGAYTDSGEPDVPEAGDVLGALPTELERTIVDYTLAQWFDAVGEENLARSLMGSYQDDISDATRDPHRKRTTTRSYRPLGLY